MTTIRSGEKIGGALGWIEYDSATDVLIMSNGTATLTIERATTAGVTAMIAALRGAANGLAPLGADSKIPAQYISQTVSSQVVANIAARDAIVSPAEAMMVTVLDASADTTVTAGAATYIRSSGAWIKIAEVESMDLVITWDNLTGKPATFPPATHSHATADVTGLDTALAGKITAPAGGAVDQVLKKTADGVTWGDSQGMTDAERARLLPLNPVAGNIAVYTDSPGGINYNDADTTLLLQKSLTNSAKSMTFQVINMGATLDGDGSIIVNNDGYMQTPDNALFGTSNAPFTIDMYLKFASVTPSSNKYILGNDDIGEGRKLNVCLRPDGKIHLQYVDGMAVNAIADEFALYSYDFDGTTIRAYVNGVLMTAKAWSYTAPSSWQGIGYDGTDWGHSPMDGRIGYLRYSTVARYKGRAFTPPGAAGYVAPPAGSWVNKTPGEVKALFPLDPWTTLPYAAAVTVPADAPQQKMTLAGNCTLTAPTLTAGQRVLLKVTGTGETLTYDSVQYTINGKYLIGWYHDGETQDCMPLREVK